MPDGPVHLTLAGVVHDLNNVFETLFEANEILREDPKYAKLAAAMERSLKHGSRIVKSLDSVEGLTDVSRLFDQVEALLSDYQMSSRGAAIAVRKQLQQGLRLHGTRGAWERVFLNLFLNAARMMPQGGGIEVIAAADAESIEIQVMDTGPGIPARLLPSLFEPGFTTTPKHKGLGLHIVRTIVEELGGKVAAENREDSTGARFRITLPLEPPPPPPPPPEIHDRP